MTEPMLEYWDQRVEDAKKALAYAEGQLLRIVFMDQPELPLNEDHIIRGNE